MNCSNELLLQPRSLHLGRIQLLYLIIKATHTQKKNLGENRSDRQKALVSFGKKECIEVSTDVI